MKHKLTRFIYSVFIYSALQHHCASVVNSKTKAKHEGKNKVAYAVTLN
ncbi:MAG: hypothetical protein GY738_04740 [Pseudoalteromonas sp.]|nr:hypothetical protein [Pseudoalteromonas sp.]